MKSRVRPLGAAAIIALLTLVAVPSQSVAKSDGGGSVKLTDAQFYAIVQQARDTGKVTAAQRAAVLTRPDLAAITIDPTSVKADYQLPGYVPDPMETAPGKVPAKSTLASRTTTQVAAASTYTTSRDRYIVYDNWLNTVLLRYHFVVAWSYNYYQVVGTPSSYTYIASCNGTCTNYGIIQNSQYPNYNGGRLYAWTVPLLAKHTYCKAGNCDTYTPSVKFGVYYDGTYHYTFYNK